MPEGRKDSQAGIDPLSQVRFFSAFGGDRGGLCCADWQHIFKRTNTNTSNILPTQQQRPRSGAPSDESGGPEFTASARTSSEPVVTRADTSGSGTKDKKYAIPTDEDASNSSAPPTALPGDAVCQGDVLTRAFVPGKDQTSSVDS